VPLSSGSVVLLGAGASKEAGVPTTFEMTRHLVERIAAYPRDRTFASALHFICGALIAYDGAEGASPFESLDVERVFAAVELLAERRTLEVTPFVAAWHPAVDAWDQGPARAPSSFDKSLARALDRDRPNRDAERLVTQLIESVTKTSGTGETYRRLAHRMVKELRQLVATAPTDIGYLIPLVAQGVEPGGLTIATLNYDLAIEGAGALAHVPLATGIEQWVGEGQWNWPADGVRLLKLHGSINWVWASTEYVEGHFPRNVVAVTESALDEGRDPVVVFGQRGKLRAEGPFLSLLAEFETQLASAKQLIVIGYSFRDDHINDLIRRWAAEDLARTILVVDPAWPEQFGPHDNSFRATLDRYLVSRADEGEPTFTSRLEVRRERCSEAIARLVA
jgi:NAD-dependent SIR2 family protein deacetylase